MIMEETGPASAEKKDKGYCATFAKNAAPAINVTEQDFPK